MTETAIASNLDPRGFEGFSLLGATLADGINYWDIAREFRSEHLCRRFEDEKKVCGQYKRVLDDLIDQAVKYAHKMSFEENELRYDVLNPIGTFVHQFSGCFLSDEELATYHTFWAHRSKPIEDIASKTRLPKMDREGLEDSAKLYLDLPVRHQRIDRCLIDALVALELFAFGDEMINEPKIPLIAPRSPLRRSHPLWAFIKAQLGNVVTACIIFALALLPHKFGWIGETGLAIAALILFGLLALGFMIGAIALPSYWRQQHKATQKVSELIAAMASVYSELNPNGLVSARHFRERATKVADDGVIWPSSLFVLLDDVEARTGRL